MPKVSVDIDKINNTLLPLVNTEMNQLNIAVSSAGKVLFPAGDFNWSKVVGGLKDCYHAMSIYNHWIQNMKESLTNSIVTSTDKLNTIKIEKVEKKES